MGGNVLEKPVIVIKGWPVAGDIKGIVINQHCPARK